MRQARTLLLFIALVIGLAACGFKLRGSWALPYESMYLDFPVQSEIGAQLKRTLRGAEATRVTEKASDAEAIFRPIGEVRDRKIITYSSGGRVQEVQLIYRYSFRIVDQKGNDLISPPTVTMTRDMSYDEDKALAKAAEEDVIWRQMMNDLTQQVMRLLAGTPRNKMSPEGATSGTPTSTSVNPPPLAPAAPAASAKTPASPTTSATTR
jgi:LPS-assembly lipoprotein